MKKFIIVLALLTSSCSANQLLQSTPIIGTVCAAADRTLVDEKVVFAAETIYNIPAHAYKTANENGKLAPELKAKLKPLLIELDGYRRAVFAAKGSLSCDFASMQQLQIEIIQLLPKGS